MKFRRTVFILTAAILAVSITGCNKTQKADLSSVSESSYAEDSSTVSEPQTEPSDPEETTEASSESDEPTESSSEETSEEDYTYDEHGAVVLDTSKEHSDATLIAAAQALFESACETEWRYTVGCPYEVDYNTYIENEFEWQFYKITNSNITSFADIEADYYKVFSSEYPNKLADLYKEKDGAVYALCGERGSDLYYVESVITDISEKTDSKITFTVENHYSGSDYTGEAPYSETEEFSVVVYDDGTWRAGEFKLPY